MAVVGDGKYSSTVIEPGVTQAIETGSPPSIAVQIWISQVFAAKYHILKVLENSTSAWPEPGAPPFHYYARRLWPARHPVVRVSVV